MTRRPCWRLAGAGNIGTMAAWYLGRAGHGVRLARPGAARRHKTLFLSTDEAARSLVLEPPADDGEPIRHLVLACKTPWNAAVLDALPLADDVCVLRLQNGIGDLRAWLPESARLIETITTNAVKGHDPVHRIMAENQTWMGDGGPRPGWFASLADHWPGLAWTTDIRSHQWAKLVANAAINPLTALYDVDNGRLLDDPTLYERLCLITAEADQLLARLDPTWPGRSQAHVDAVARATAANTSSMRADVQKGAITEIAAINGWLLARAAELGLDLPANRAVVHALAGRAAD
ncbi:ketopantoate reductase C-terminal domain-containing protein [Salinisphaera sp. T31B1]|uniref:ketopantoate reductase family protein n=1 Tax=Salinisphaera sp. T31B1 TaxID=727963 RepID=UPI00334088DA